MNIKYISFSILWIALLFFLINISVYAESSNDSFAEIPSDIQIESILPSPNNASTWILSGGPSPYDPIIVDDDLEVKINGVTIFKDDDGYSSLDGRSSWKGNPIDFSAFSGDELEIIATNPGGGEIELSTLYLNHEGHSSKLSDGVPKIQSKVIEFFKSRYTLSTTPLVEIIDYSRSPVHGNENLTVNVSWSYIPEGWKLVVSLEESESDATRLANDTSKMVSGYGEGSFELIVFPTEDTYNQSKIFASLYDENLNWASVFDKQDIIIYPTATSTHSLLPIFGVVFLITLVFGFLLFNRNVISNNEKKQSRELNKGTLSKLSKLMAYILRHDNEFKFQVELDENCYADIDQLIKAISSMDEWNWINRRHIEEVAAKSNYRNKRRFLIKRNKIKATYRITRDCPSSNITTLPPKQVLESSSYFEENEWYTIIAKHSGKCMDVSGKSIDNGVKIIQYDYRGGDNQLWKFKPIGNGYFQIIAKHSGKCLDVGSKSINNGAKIIQYDYLGGDNQLWKLDPVNNGYFRIIAKHSGKCLDVSGMSIDNGVKIIQYDYWGGDNQLWKFLKYNHVLTPSSIFPPEIQPKYTDIEFLDKGGFARVFKAVRKNDGKLVAVKIPISLDEATGKSFIREIKSWEELDHPNIVKLYNMNIMPLPYFEMEYVENKSLEELEKPLEVEKAASIVFDISEGLKYAHSMGRIHRDIKPGNVLITNNLVPKITDWGLGKILTDSKTSSQFAFTPSYAAPEQISPRKFGIPDIRTDIYQLGTIFYELVTDRPPFEGEDFSEVGFSIINDKPVNPSIINPGCKEIDAIILKCLNKQPDERYQTISEFQHDLAGYLKVEYTKSLVKSTGDIKRSCIYCGDLVLIHAKLGDVESALKYAIDMKNYAGDKWGDEMEDIAKQLEYLVSRTQPIGNELMTKIIVVAHQMKMGR